MFDWLVKDQDSVSLYPEALFGRGLSRIGMRKKDAGNADLAEARKREAHVAEQFDGLNQ